MAYDITLTALADPTRRRIYERVRVRPHSVGELAKVARISQPAASQHLRVLKKARLVTADADGARRLYRANQTGLADLRKYVESLWGDVLTAYAAADPAPPSKTHK